MRVCINSSNYSLKIIFYANYKSYNRQLRDPKHKDYQNLLKTASIILTILALSSPWFLSPQLPHLSSLFFYCTYTFGIIILILKYSSSIHGIPRSSRPRLDLCSQAWQSLQPRSTIVPTKNQRKYRGGKEARSNILPVLSQHNKQGRSTAVLKFKIAVLPGIRLPPIFHLQQIRHHPTHPSNRQLQRTQSLLGS